MEQLDVKNKQSIIWYIIAGIGFIPLIGIPFGIIGIIRGLITFKKYGFKLLIIALLSFVPMTLMYGTLYFMTQQKDGVVSKLDVQLKRRLVTEAVAEIEMYKTMTGEYPDSLSEIKNRNSLKFIVDSTGKLANDYYYRKSENGYVLGSVGKDSIQGTFDDVVPVLKDTTKRGIKNSIIGNIDSIALKELR